MYQTSSVGVRSCVSSQASESSVSFPAWFSARIARLVSRTLPQLSERFLPSSSATQSSKMLSGVARIVSATSWVVRLEQSSAFSSRQVKPLLILSGSCWDDVEVVVSVVSVVVSVVSVVLSVSLLAESVSGTSENISKNNIRNAPVFFMY